MNNIGLGDKNDNVLFMQHYWYSLSYIQRVDIFLNMFNVDLRYSLYYMGYNNDE